MRKIDFSNDLVNNLLASRNMSAQSFEKIARCNPLFIYNATAPGTNVRNRVVRAKLKIIIM